MLIKVLNLFLFIGGTKLTDNNIPQDTSQNSTEGNSNHSKCANIANITAHNSANPSNVHRQVDNRNAKFWHQLSINYFCICLVVLPRNSGMLIFLVTCLIVALAVVVLFLAIKIRRAHIHWKRGRNWGYIGYTGYRGLILVHC